jgi:hypothetical protein
MLRNRKAQAVLELAILGSIIIVAFSILIDYSEKLNREQSYMQQTFRAALKKAQALNNSASWQTVDFRRMPNVANPMELGQLQQFASGNSVLWSDGQKLAGVETQPKSYFELNRTELVEIPISGGPGPQEGTLTSSSSGYTSNLTSNTSFEKTEASGNITTHKQLDATDNLAYSDTTVGGISSALGSGGKYTGGGLHRKTENTQDQP